jgi:hypothetical protein
VYTINCIHFSICSFQFVIYHYITLHSLTKGDDKGLPSKTGNINISTEENLRFLVVMFRTFHPLLNACY